ncbi:MAG: KEOPS complex subunit Pcc1 [Halobacteriota archaeon]
MAADVRTTVRLDGEHVEAVYRAVEPELGEVEGRGSTEVRYDGGLHVVSRSPDVVSARAALNTSLGLIEVAEPVLRRR